MSQAPIVNGWEDRVVAGPTVFLRRPSEADRDVFCALVRASYDFLRPWEPWLHEGKDRDGHLRFDRLLALRESRVHLKHFMCRRDDGTILGCMNLNNVVLGVFQNTALGYWIGAPHARRGYASEALQLALHLAFDGLGLHRVEANIKPNNDPSIRLVERAGFRNEGYSARMLKIAGEWADHVRYAILVDEWEPRLESVEVV